MFQSYMDTSAPPIFALELAEAIVHIQVKWVYAGAYTPPIPESHPVQTFSHLSTCEILHTSHYWSMTVSANFIRCFFYMLFTQIIWIIVLVDFGASFFYVITLKLVVTKLFFSLVFLEDCFVLILSIWNNCYLLILYLPCSFSNATQP